MTGKQTAQPEEEAKEEELEAPTSEEETEDTEETLEEAEEESDEESEEEEEVEVETITIKWNGENIDVPLEEAVNLAQKGYDYSQKMSQLSDKAKEEGKKMVEKQLAEMEAKRTEFTQKAELVESLYNQPLVSKEKLDELRAGS